MTTIAEAERVQVRFRQEFGRIPGVRGIGVTWNDEGEAHIRVNIDSEASPGVEKIVPSVFEGVAIEVRHVRNMRAFAQSH